MDPDMENLAVTEGQLEAEANRADEGQRLSGVNGEYGANEVEMAR